MSRKSTCAISSSISSLTSAAIWIHMEMPDATILSSRLPRVERKSWRARTDCPRTDFRPRHAVWRRTSFLDYSLTGEGNPPTLGYCCLATYRLDAAGEHSSSPATQQDRSQSLVDTLLQGLLEA